MRDRLLDYATFVNMPEYITLSDPPSTRRLGIALGSSLPAGSVLLLEGDLGSGKTTLIQAIGAGLGITENIDSPTFTLINEYLEGRLPLYHLDLYRLEPADVATLHPEMYWEAVEFPSGIVAIEWADKLPYKPSSYLEICLAHASEDRRQISLKAVGEFDLAILQRGISDQ